MTASIALTGPRCVLEQGDEGFPSQLLTTPNPPKRLYVVGDIRALVPGLAVIGARKATPYGRGCARRFARLAAEKGAVIFSGGARGCDSAAHRAALDAGGLTVAVLGGGCDDPYPAENIPLFQRIIEAGGAVVSEYDWSKPPMPFRFRERNRIIAGLADAVLIVEAGLPSGTFSTADEAIDAGREVLVVPGSITSSASRGANRLLFQGAQPVIDDETFEEALFRTCGLLKRPSVASPAMPELGPVVDALRAQPMTVEALLGVAVEAYGPQTANAKLMEVLVEAEALGIVARHPDGRWGPVVAG